MSKLEETEDISMSSANCDIIKANIDVIIDAKRAEDDKKRKEQQLAMLEAKKKKQEANAAQNGGKKNKRGKKNNKKNKPKEEEEKKVLNEEALIHGLKGLENFVGRKKIDIVSRDINVEGVTIAFGPEFLLDNAHLILNWGVRYGLVGRNGCGKTTLMNMISAREIHVSDTLLMHLCNCEVAPSEMTAMECVLSVDTERVLLLKALDEQASSDTPNIGALEYINNRLAEIESDTAEMRASEILNGLGFDKHMQNKKVKEYSGGWRMRVSISQALFLKPDVLLLDEPTNHLDLESCLWLEDYLSKWEKIILVVSHAQDFLNGVCTKIVHFDKGKLTYFGGNYDQFIQTKEELMIQVITYFYVANLTIYF
jgi:ATP-binding cassette subfamily F protein 2